MQTPRLPLKANGSGDVTSALFTAHLLATDAPTALGRTAASVFALLDETLRSGERELRLVAAQDVFVDPPTTLRGASDPMRLLVYLLLFAVVTACGASSTDDAPSADRATDVAFVTELMHRDAALLNLLDVALGRRLDPALVAATDQLRVDANARIETAADQLESWGEKVPQDRARPRLRAQHRRT